MSATSSAADLRVKISDRQVLSIALPIAAAMVVPQVNFITNNIFLGGLGRQQLAVAGITGVYYLIFAVIGLGLNTGLQGLIARRAGEQRVGEIGHLFHQGIYISFVLAVAGIGITWFIAPAVFRLSLHDTAHQLMATRFLFIRIWGLPFLYIYVMRNALLAGTNQTRLLIWGTLAETGANIFFDYGLIYGHFGLPALGFNGAAWASIIAEATGLVVIFIIMRANGVSRKLQLFRQVRYDWATTRLILVQSSPLILQNAISIITWEIFYVMIEHQGEQALAVSNVMRNIFGLFGCVNWAFGSATNTMVSNIMGQQRPNEVLPMVWRIIRLSLYFAAPICVLLNLWPGLLLNFYGQDASFRAAAEPVVRIVSLALLMQAVAVIWLNSVVGTGNTVVNLLTETFTIVVYLIYTWTVLEKLRLSLTWGWASEWLYWLCMFTPSFLYMRSGRWRGKRI